LRTGCDEIVTYDDELATAARSAGLAVVAPAGPGTAKQRRATSS
jgi:hypothetical protein